MRFFDREQELSKLQQVRMLSQENAMFTVVTGRRRIGKTSLVLHAFDDEPILYFFVARKAESELCRDYVEEISLKLNVPVLGSPTRFSEIFDYLMKLSHTKAFTLFIDEFQDFYRINRSVFSEMQRIWDINKAGSHINLIVGGSINTLMNRIFKNEKEPLYGRQTLTLKVMPFRTKVLKDILQEYQPGYSNEDLLSLYLYTGGVAKYVELLTDYHQLNAGQMIDFIIAQDSPFIDEGKNLLVDEFGKDYSMYFSILSLIARGHNTRGDMEGILGVEIGGQLTKLQDDYGLVSKEQPLLEKSANKNIHYVIRDNFLRFWFRFVYKYNYMLEIGAFDKLREIVRRDYATYSGKVLEAYFREKLKESGDYTRIGFWHDRKGENEIDIIAADDLNQRVTFYEVKRQASDLDMAILRSKSDVFLKSTHSYADYEIVYQGLSMADM